MCIRLKTQPPCRAPRCAPRLRLDASCPPMQRCTLATCPVPLPRARSCLRPVGGSCPRPVAVDRLPPPQYGSTALSLRRRRHVSSAVSWQERCDTTPRSCRTCACCSAQAVVAVCRWQARRRSGAACPGGQPRQRASLHIPHGWRRRQRARQGPVTGPRALQITALALRTDADNLQRACKQSGDGTPTGLEPWRAARHPRVRTDDGMGCAASREDQEPQDPWELAASGE